MGMLYKATPHFSNHSLSLPSSPSPIPPTQQARPKQRVWVGRGMRAMGDSADLQFQGRSSNNSRPLKAVRSARSSSSVFDSRDVFTNSEVRE